MNKTLMSELVSLTDSKTIATLSGWSIDDADQTYLAVNTWLLMGVDLYGERPIVRVKAYIQREGLKAAITAANELAQDLIDGVFPLPASCFVQLFYAAVQADESLDGLRSFLSFLRYLKRFTPQSDSAMKQASIEGFYENLSRVRVVRPPMWLLADLRPCVARVLRGCETWSERDFFKEPLHLSELPNGSSYGCGKSQYNKFNSAINVAPLAFGFTSAISYCDGDLLPDNDPRFSRWTVRQPLVDRWGHVSCCGLTPVPKNYKSWRIIANEEALRLAYQKRVMTRVRELLKRNTNGRLDLSDQAPNQVAARVGSYVGSIATIDFSKASDSVTEWLVRSVFPATYVRITDGLRARYIDTGTKLMTNPLWGTMGSRLTFDAETILFYSLAILSCDYVVSLTGSPVDYDCVRAYGDDVVLPSECAETFMDLAKLLGFIPNYDKSYFAGPYRESCGCEYYAGYDISSKYWPRHAVDEINSKNRDVELVVDAVNLQHKLHEFPSCDAFLVDFVLSLEPNCTFSRPGSDCDDLWSLDDDIQKADIEPLVINGETKPFPNAARENAWCTREIHVVNGSNCTAPRMTKRVREDVEWILYQCYLYEGPQYDDSLSELLHVSTRRSIGQLTGVPAQIRRTKRI